MMWKFSEAVVLGKHAQIFADGEEKNGSNNEDKAPYKLTIEERVLQKMEAAGLKVPKSLAIKETERETVVSGL
jgi:hypothetical protein